MAKKKEIAARLMRLTWNKFNWQRPQGHKWSKSKQGNTSIAYENQCGFGHEEWLFNPDFCHDGYQYGYIRGIDGMPYDDLFIEKVILFTIHGETKVRYLVGELTNVEIIEYPKRVKKLFRQELKSVVDQLKEVKADYESFQKDGFWFNVRFKPENANIYPQLIYRPYLEEIKSKIKRFQPFKLTSEEVEKLQIGSLNKPTFNFRSGEKDYKDKYQRTEDTSEKNVVRLHSAITRDLVKFHKSVLGFQAENLSAEMTTLGSRILDFVISENDQFSIFEVKTNLSGILNFRQALGQLFEYSFLDQSVKIKKLVIVGPVSLNVIEKDYLLSLRKLIPIPFEYWAYKKSESDIEKKFLIY